jgi:antitoxin VapB
MFLNMITLSEETETLARRVAVAKSLPVEDAVRRALEAFERGTPLLPEPAKPRDLSPGAVAARKASIDRLVAEIAALPVLDPRPVEEIVDDLNSI